MHHVTATVSLLLICTAFVAGVTVEKVTQPETLRRVLIERFETCNAQCEKQVFLEPALNVECSLSCVNKDCWDRLNLPKGTQIDGSQYVDYQLCVQAALKEELSATTQEVEPGHKVTKTEDGTITHEIEL